MTSNARFQSLPEAVKVGLSCAELGLDKKDAIAESILGYVADHYVNLDDIATPEELPVSVLDHLTRLLGVGFEMHNGQLTTINTSTLCVAAARWGDIQGGI